MINQMLMIIIVALAIFNVMMAYLVARQSRALTRDIAELTAKMEGTRQKMQTITMIGDGGAMARFMLKPTAPDDEEA